MVNVSANWSERGPSSRILRRKKPRPRPTHRHPGQRDAVLVDRKFALGCVERSDRDLRIADPAAIGRTLWKDDDRLRIDLAAAQCSAEADGGLLDTVAAALARAVQKQNRRPLAGFLVRTRKPDLHFLPSAELAAHWIIMPCFFSSS